MKFGKLFLAVAFFLAAAFVPMHAQQPSVVLVHVQGVPSAKCSSDQLIKNDLTGDLYSCANGVPYLIAQGAIASGTQCFPAVYSITGSQLGPTSTVCDASAFYTGSSTFTQDIVAAYSSTQCTSSGCLIVVPNAEGAHGSGAATTPILPDNVSLQFSGGANTFTFCAIRAGAFSKIDGTANAALTELGSNCPGVEWIDNTPTLQSSDHPALKNIRINANNQTNSTGVTIGPGSSGGTAMFDLENVEVTGATTVGIYASQMQFSHWRNVHIQQNYVNLKLYGNGAGSSNIFDGLKVDSNSSGVNVIITNNQTNQDSGGNIFINPQLQNGSVASMAVIGDPGDLPPNVVIIGSQPELNNTCAGSVTIDSRTIPCSGALYVSNAQVNWLEPDFADAAATPEINLANNASLTLVDPTGYAGQFNQLVIADSTSIVNLQGNSWNAGSIVNVSSWPDSITGSRGSIAGAPISRLDSTVPNAFAGNPLTPAFSSTTGTSSNAIALDSLYGPVNTVTFAASPGNGSTNTVAINSIIPSGYTSVTSDYLFSVLVMASATTSVQIYCHYSGGDIGFKYPTLDPLTLRAGQWTRVVGYNYGISAGAECDLQAYPNDSVGATLSFTRLEAIAGPSGNSGGYVTSPTDAFARAQVVHSGAVNPNGAVPVPGITGTNNSSLMSFYAPLANGSASPYDQFTIQNVCGSSANPTCQITFGHPAGTSGSIGYNFPTYQSSFVSGNFSTSALNLNSGINLTMSGGNVYAGTTEASYKDISIQNSSVANASTTGTSQYKLVKLTGAPSTAVIAATTDTSAIIGICDSSCSTSGNPIIATSGIENCAFDGATTAGDYVQISSTTAGDCHDTGSGTVPSTHEVIGRVLATIGSAGNASVLLILKDQ